MEDWIISFRNEYGGTKAEWLFSVKELYKADMNYILSLMLELYFKINPLFIAEWNTYITDEWAGLDDADYYSATPKISNERFEEFGNEWLTYDREDGIISLKEAFYQAREYTKHLQQARTVLNNSCYKYK